MAAAAPQGYSARGGGSVTRQQERPFALPAIANVGSSFARTRRSALPHTGALSIALDPATFYP